MIHRQETREPDPVKIIPATQAGTVATRSLLTREDVYRLYEAALGRCPESEEIIERQLRLHKSAVSLTCALCNSDEFRLRIKGPLDHLFDGYRADEIEIIRRYFMHSAPELAFVKDPGTRIRLPWERAWMMTSYAQALEDVVLSRALRHVEKGFWIDVGANHPLLDSVTKSFSVRGWSGINIEPVSQWFTELMKD